MGIPRELLQEYARRYDRDYPERERGVEVAMKHLLARQRFLTRDDLLKIGRWKSPRAIHHYESNDPVRVRRASSESFREEDERRRTELLLGSKGGLTGVGYPVASTILHFAFPNKYPIMDFRVIAALEHFEIMRPGDHPSTYTFHFWHRYSEDLRGISRCHRLTLREVEKALWKYHKENLGRGPCRDR